MKKELSCNWFPERRLKVITIIIRFFPKFSSFSPIKKMFFRQFFKVCMYSAKVWKNCQILSLTIWGKLEREKKLQFILYYTRYLNGHFWEPKMFTVQCWHKISFTRSAKAKNKVVCWRNCDLIFTVSCQSREGHRIGEREQL